MSGEAGLPFERLVVRPAQPSELARFDELLDADHYLGSCRGPVRVSSHWFPCA
ncbi:MAG: hypothetical protein HY775_09310 [Acidobacteria bacterium]|nr:hypothetical protein [Acidobacteriota bacterium]